ncbi:SDR family oxidoreductase [Azoarcus olearius]|uniref:Short-chain dehydrogenase family protein n=1 Tax=Azoarcus sp. (strain BH72) TaxID=418699 RepID=A1K6H0_AZOSB|nr:SDR family oxidoreductase [Azoarcus olearius]ANQ84995.1 short-chain dehydrogenase [Azoarcus olearius]CAL94425.1 Short-chain dehydrogenase family protein [Azoarcus olearius]
MRTTSTIPLDNKTALVTGGARGLGKALCEALCEAGCRVVLVDVRADLAEATSRALIERGHQTMHCAVDIGDERQVIDCLAAARERFGAIDILINNAGVDYTQPIDELETAQWDHVMAVNLRAPFLFCKQIVTQMKPLGGGHIVNITSTAAKRAWPNACAYHASKWALLGFSHALHAELRPHGIKVTAVVAGGMRTPFLLDRFPDIDVNTLQPPESVANAVLQVLQMPAGSVVPEISVLPMGETSWP